MRHYCSLILALSWGGTLCSFAQGDANLLLQYNRGPTFESLYHPWNIKIHLLGVRINASDDTRPRLTWGAGMLFQHKFKGYKHVEDKISSQLDSLRALPGRVRIRRN